MINESARQFYLQQLGITSYYSRHRLPGAAPSPEFAWAQAAAQPLPVNDKPERQHVPEAAAPARASAEVARLQRQAAASLDRPAALRAAVGSPAAPAAAGDADAFSFVWFSPQPTLAILAQQPDGHRGRLPPSLRTLMMRILQALDPDFVRLTSRQVASFHWPFDTLSATAGRAAARDAVIGFIAQRRRQFPVQNLLLLVDELPWFLYAPAQHAELQTAQWHTHPVLDMQVLCVPSLQAMENEPALKKPAWQAMQQLMALLPGPDAAGTGVGASE